MASNNEWFVNHGNKIHGPFSSAQLKQLAAQSKIKPDTLVRLGTEGKWTAAEKVKGLFPSTELTAAPAPKAAATKAVATKVPTARTSELVTQPATVPVAVRSTTIEAIVPMTPMAAPVAGQPATITRSCPFCGEDIAQTAIKCKHCGEFLDGRPRHHPAPVAVAPAPSVNVVVNQTMVGHVGKRWSRLVAMVLSLVIPGAGQLYKGQALNAIVWFVVVVAGYVAFVLPGVVLHLFCIIGAATGDPYR
jgi:TM2 domain-containing membrane protein YozV